MKRYLILCMLIEVSNQNIFALCTDNCKQSFSRSVFFLKTESKDKVCVVHSWPISRYFKWQSCHKNFLQVSFKIIRCSELIFDNTFTWNLDRGTLEVKTKTARSRAYNIYCCIEYCSDEKLPVKDTYSCNLPTGKY